MNLEAIRLCEEFIILEFLNKYRNFFSALPQNYDQFLVCVLFLQNGNSEVEWSVKYSTISILM